jgi:EmrB/QacA subfamily drug resistance transporter
VTTSPPAHAPLTPRQFFAATAAVMMTILLGALDQTIVSVALPSIARQLGGFEWMAWVISGYLIAATVVTPLYGKFSDLFGRRRVLGVAIVIFVLASAACALARDMPQLVLARVLQGVGGGGLIALAQAVVADVVPVRDRGRYQSYISIVWVVASMLGPVVGGVLTEQLSWPWIFWINLPLGLIALVLVETSLRTLPLHRGEARIDGLGAFLLLAGLTAALIPITRVGQGGAVHDRLNLIGWALAAVLLLAFLWQQRRHPEPIVPMALLANPVVVGGCAMLFLLFFNFIALSVLVPLRVQMVAGLNATDAALRLLPMTLAIPVSAFFGGRWLGRTGRVRPPQWIGVALVPLALFTLGFVPATGAGAFLGLIGVGVGMGLQISTTLITVQQSVPPTMIGTVTGLTGFFRLLGGAIGIAVLSTIALLLLRAHLPVEAQGLAEGHSPLMGVAQRANPASDGAFRQLMWVCGGVALLSLWFVRRMPDLRLHQAHGTPAEAAAESLS